MTPTSRPWKKASVAPTDSIQATIEQLNASRMQIILVVDQNDRLLGTVTDGDIRRGILKKLPIDSPVEKIMNAKPKTAKKGDDTDTILRLMKKHTIRHLPVVDEDNRVVSLEVLDELLKPQEKDNWVVLMAGGMGSRLFPLTSETPKPLLPVGDKPLLETILIGLQNSGFRKFFISVNYKADLIEKHFGDGSKWAAEIQYVREDKPLGTAGALGLLPAQPDKPVLVMNADVLTKVNFQKLLEFHENQRSKLTMCVREYDHQVPYGVVNLHKNTITSITSIEEKPKNKIFVNAGIYVLEPSVIAAIPKGKPWDMPNLINELIARKEKAAAFPITEYWIDVGHHADFERANSDFEGEFSK